MWRVKFKKALNFNTPVFLGRTLGSRCCETVNKFPTVGVVRWVKIQHDFLFPLPSSPLPPPRPQPQPSPAAPFLVAETIQPFSVPAQLPSENRSTFFSVKQEPQWSMQGVALAADSSHFTCKVTACAVLSKQPSPAVISCRE